METLKMEKKGERKAEKEGEEYQQQQQQQHQKRRRENKQRDCDNSSPCTHSPFCIVERFIEFIYP